MSYFTEEALRKFNELCSEGLDFGESPVYDFARCIKSSGEVYGVSPNEVCREGKPISDSRAKKAQNKDGKSRLAKLRIAFRKKTGRELTKEELEKAKGVLGGKGIAKILAMINN